MKRILLLLLSCLFFQISFSQSISNPGFESLGENSLPESWGKNNQPFDFLVDSLHKQSGRYSMGIKDRGEKGFGSFSQSFELTSDQLKKYRYSGYIKTQDVSEGFVGLWVSAMAGKKTLFFDNMNSQGLKGTKDWQKYEIEFIIDKTITSVRLGGLMTGKGQAWFDDFVFEEIEFEAKEPIELVDNYLNEVKEILQKHSLMKDSVDFENMMKMARVMASDAKTTEETYSAVKYMLNSLGDNHSFLMAAKRANNWANTSKAEKPVKVPQATGRIIDKDFGYISMPSFGSGDPNTMKDFADSIQNLIKRLDQTKPKGWILDLRNNPGGNCWPMLAGIGPILGKGLCGYFISGEGKVSDWSYKKGSSKSGRHKITRVRVKPYKFDKPFVTVAVLTGKSTASSGEVVTVAFRERPNTRSFGQPTAGLSTGNRQFNLSDGAKIFLTSSVYADRTKHRYGHKIVPDEVIEYNPKDITKDNDPVIDAAINWLKGETK